jgi:hypothetical protein
MGVRFGSEATSTQLNPLVASSANVVLYTIAPLVVCNDAAVVLLQWAIVVVPGTTTSFLSVTLYQGPTTSYPQVFNASWLALAVPGNSQVMSGCIFDVPGGGSIPYSLALSTVGATVAGTLTDGNFLVFVL